MRRWGGAVPGGEVGPVGEPGDVTDLDQQPGGAGGPDAVQVHQRGAGGGDKFLEFFVGLFGASVDSFEVGDQLRGDPAAGLADRVTRSDRGQQCLGLGDGQALLRATRNEFEQQLVQLGDHPGVMR